MALFMDEILALTRKGKNLTKDIEDLGNMNTKSIARRAKGTTCQFPCIVADSIPLNMASAVTKNMDRVYASFVQTVIASNPLIDITIDRSPLDYMKRLHQNLRLESAIDEDALFRSERETNALRSFMESECPNLSVPEDLYESVMDKVYNGEYKLYLDETGTFGVAFSEAVINSDVMDENKRLFKEHLSDFDLRPFPVSEASNKTMKEDILRSVIDNANASAAATSRDEGHKYSKDLNTPRMVDRDVKRVNELQPYGLSVRLMAVNDRKEFVQYIDFIVGIKTILHVAKSREMVSNIGNVLKNRNFTFNFIRWTTGEISFFKDLVLHLDDIKMDTSYRSRGASPWFPTLKRLKDKKFNVSLSGVTKLVPNATFVISSFEVDDLKNEYGFDVRDIYFAKKVIKELFLLAFVIVDEGSETIDILYEGNDSFETYTLETLEREVSLSSNKLGKEIGRMISQ